jgi:hypothetical protein
MHKESLVRCRLGSRRSLTRDASRVRRRSRLLGSAPPQAYCRVEGQHRCGAIPFVRLADVNGPTVFQQVDIDGSYDNLHAGPQIHMFGVTQVLSAPSMCISIH